MNFKNIFLALALVSVASSRAADVVAPVAASAVCDSCVVGNALNSVKIFVLDNKKTVIAAAVILGAIAYFVATADDADADNI